MSYRDYEELVERDRGLAGLIRSWSPAVYSWLERLVKSITGPELDIITIASPLSLPIAAVKVGYSVAREGIGAGKLVGLLRERDNLIKTIAKELYEKTPKYTRQGIDIDDLVQEGRIGFYRALESYDPTKATITPEQFAITVAKNKMRDFLRAQHVTERASNIGANPWRAKRVPMPETRFVEEGEAITWDIPQKSASALESLIQEENLNLLRKGISTLPPRKREIMERIIRGEDNRTIAEAMGISEGTVAAAKNQAINALKQYFQSIK